MQRDEAAYLLDILLSAEEVMEFTKDLTWETFKKSRIHQHAISRSIEIMGEAAQKVSSATRDA